MNIAPAIEDFRTIPRARDVVAADRIRWLILVGVACLYLPFVASGPGSNPDSIRELNSGAMLLWQHRYVMSRPPGYFPYELLCGVLYFFGGSVATNCASAVISLMLLDSFLYVCDRFEVPHRHLLAMALASHPIYWTASTSTIDYIWALGCFVFGWRLILDGRYLGAGAMLGLAIGIRIASALLVAPLLTWSLVATPREARLWITGALAAAFGAALYLPAYIASGYSFAFLVYFVGSWTWTGYLGRFIYKNVYFWGLPAAALLIAMTPAIICGLRQSARRFHPIVGVSLSIVILIEGLFLKIPVQRAYLLPMLPFALILVGIAMRDRGRALLAMTVLLVSYNFVNVNIIRPDVANHATRAILGLSVEPGFLIADTSQRLALRETHF